jgi:hypothetical protein
MDRHCNGQEARSTSSANVPPPGSFADAPGRSTRRGPRSRQETAAERHALQEATNRELDQIAAEFHDRLPRGKARSIGVIYARYSSRFQHSIADQVRSLYEAALKQASFVPRDFVYYDLAVRGYKEQRPGLNGLRARLIAGGIDLLLVFTTNRLFRKTYKALQFVEEEVVERGIRCLFIKSGVDTADADRWRMLLQVHAMTDEFVVGMYADNVRAAHEGLFERGMVCGTVCFGYTAQPIPGEFTKRKRPRCRVVTDPDARPWVEQIYSWYVLDRVSIGEIVRRLNADPSIPLGPKAVTGRWTYLAVRRLLANPRYRGCWEYGATQNVWQSKSDYSRQVARPQPLRSTQVEELRIITDEMWHAAQQRLAEGDRAAVGRKPRDGDQRSRPKVLHGLFRCPEHNQMLYVGGSHGQYLFCRACQALPSAQRPLYSQLPRALALQATCAKLAALVSSDDEMVAQVFAACRDEAQRAQRPDPRRIEELRKKEKQLNQQIEFVLQNAGETDTDRRESAEKLKALRRSRSEMAAEISHLEARGNQPVAAPSEEELRDLLRQLGSILASAAAGELNGQAHPVREVLRLLTGARIDLYQQGERKAKRGWLQGRFRVRLLPYLLAHSASAIVHEDAPNGAEVVIDYRPPADTGELAERVKELYDRGLLIKAAAAQLGISVNRARRELFVWFRQHGQEPPDGRSRRSGLACKHLCPPKYQEIAEDAKRLYDDGLPLGEIAAKLASDRNTITKSLAYYHKSHSLPVVDGRTRRKILTSQRNARSDPPNSPVCSDALNAREPAAGRVSVSSCRTLELVCTR